MDDSEIHALSTNGLSPVPEECLHGMRSPGFIQELCIPPFLNGMIVHAATDRIKEESILIGWVPVFSATLDQFGNSLEFDKELAFSVLFSEVSARRLYGVLRHIPDPRTSLNRSKNLRASILEFYVKFSICYLSNSQAGETVFMNELLVRPENYTIQTMIVEPKQDYVNDTSPSFIVSVHKSSPAIYRGPGIRLSEPGNNIRGLDLGVADIPCSEKFNFTMEMGKKNLTRYYYRHLPRNKTAKAILIQYHGWSSSCEKWEEYSKTAAIADKYGFMLISACGSYYGFYSSWFRSTSGWNAGVCCIRDNDVDDVEYTKQILKNENKNNLPVYGYGYSNGGMMVESLLCHNVLDKAVSVNAVLALKPGLQGAFKTCDTIYRNETSIAPKVASVHCADDGSLEVATQD
ncbi:hypothetical protein Pmar_PMAR001803 [Perkinsus marinus ATCC 50983]|uniref:Peptidase S9 prolyl oligopeptidase catalytic domain-containing protein n=1 Tax=Perkinsus marinus (strain ATCC 50983 / TXsc) TaxID=423536 RepID=C5LJP1_PERM5|nr:hypothetical protein Pmar_PMAR001803 [Perkinsus marinus ATCC 50983]EER03058.1 hypothetical protein Pmar_PMAR001803 [Perkinsus marinus ATCC 50983]|eukprot:XP_002771242.1 hypothetical protein Pmar_PMAR001803 [Perkinsus marinus ATCC 50983]